ncbi:LamG domain-containing protein [Streptomyces sp. NBC_00328]|uniref:LamG domain-containing protein n=1 Tax=Streptomyces sp. NBC_00328 TaxID=2903646 RepID=UPI002E28050E|nr:LamG domain-containing protein [Streptomyces sp. NBC_00328]
MTRRRRAAGLLAVLVAGAAMTQAACGGRTPSAGPPASYDAAVRSDSPALYLPLGAGNTVKRSTAGLEATCHHAPGVTSMPNGDQARLFDGTSQYVEVPDDDRLSVTTTGELTVEAWMRPDTLTFPRTAGSGYVNWLGKVSAKGVGTEWLARMYSRDNTEVRANRISGYVFNRGGGLGAGSYFEDRVRPGEWIHYALVINIRDKSDTYPTGYVKIYKNGVLRDQDALDDYDIAPSNTDAPLRIGAADATSYFKGAIGKVAVYDSEVSQSRLAAHYAAMSADLTRSAAGT